MEADTSLRSIALNKENTMMDSIRKVIGFLVAVEKDETQSSEVVNSVTAVQFSELV
jgi:hypothetical protein